MRIKIPGKIAEINSVKMDKTVINGADDFIRNRFLFVTVHCLNSLVD